MGDAAPLKRAAGLVAVCGLFAWFTARGQRVPLLGLVDLGVHELGHLVCYVADAFLPWSELVTAGAGSAAQVAAPLALAAYFVRRRDVVGSAFCLAWAGTSTADVARYVGDAPHERLPLLGGEHDWAAILGPEHLDALHRAADLAYGLRVVGWALLGAAALVAVWPVVATPAAQAAPAARR